MCITQKMKEIMATIWDCFEGNKREIYKYLGKRKGAYTGFRDLNGVSIRHGDLLFSPYHSSLVECQRIYGDVSVRNNSFAYNSFISGDFIVVGTKYNHESLYFISCFEGQRNPTIELLYRITIVTPLQHIRRMIKDGTIHSEKTRKGRTKLSWDDIHKAFEDGVLFSLVYTGYDFTKGKTKFAKLICERFNLKEFKK